MASSFQNIPGRRSDIAVSLEDLAFLPLRQCVHFYSLPVIHLLALALTRTSNLWGVCPGISLTHERVGVILQFFEICVPVVEMFSLNRTA